MKSKAFSPLQYQTSGDLKARPPRWEKQIPNKKVVKPPRDSPSFGTPLFMPRENKNHKHAKHYKSREKLSKLSRCLDLS